MGMRDEYNGTGRSCILLYSLSTADEFPQSKVIGRLEIQCPTDNCSKQDREPKTEWQRKQQCGEKDRYEIRRKDGERFSSETSAGSLRKADKQVGRYAAYRRRLSGQRSCFSEKSCGETDFIRQTQFLCGCAEEECLTQNRAEETGGRTSAQNS